MTNLEMLLRNDPMILDFVSENISEKYCINTETMKADECIRCYKCPFFKEEDCNYECDNRAKAWLLEEYKSLGGVPDE